MIFVSDVNNFIHIAGMPIEMDRNDSLCLGSDGGLNLVNVDIEIVCNVHQDRCCPTLHDSPYCSNKSMSYCNDFITGSKSKRTRRQIKGIRPRIDTNGMFRPY